jgi:hypothetical protein
MTPDATVLPDTERRRLGSLVEVDMDAADALHADDYQLINPRRMRSAPPNLDTMPLSLS